MRIPIVLLSAVFFTWNLAAQDVEPGASAF